MLRSVTTDMNRELAKRGLRLRKAPGKLFSTLGEYYLQSTRPEDGRLIVEHHIDPDQLAAEVLNAA